MSEVTDQRLSWVSMVRVTGLLCREDQWGCGNWRASPVQEIKGNLSLERASCQLRTEGKEKCYVKETVAHGCVASGVRGSGGRPFEREQYWSLVNGRQSQGHCWHWQSL